MRIIASNGGYMRPYGGRLPDGQTPGLGPARLPCRCLLVEHADGLVLVGTGFGRQDAADRSRIAAAMRAADRPSLEADEAAVTQFGPAGYDRRDVRHIVMTLLERFPFASAHENCSMTLFWQASSSDKTTPFDRMML